MEFAKQYIGMLKQIISILYKFIRNYDENSDKGHFLEVDVDYPKKSFDLHKDLPFLLERKKVNKVEKLI